MRIGDTYDRAIEDYNKAIELDPKFEEAYNARLVAYEKKELFRYAIADYERACYLGLDVTCKNLSNLRQRLRR